MTTQSSRPSSSSILASRPPHGSSSTQSSIGEKRTFDHHHSRNSVESPSVPISSSPLSQSTNSDSSTYVADLIAKGSLRELVSLASRLEDQVQQLESSAQSLVYDNYSEFLTAADTAQALNFNIHSHCEKPDQSSSRVLTPDRDGRTLSPSSSNWDSHHIDTPIAELQHRLDQIVVDVQNVYEPLQMTAKSVKVSIREKKTILLALYRQC